MSWTVKSRSVEEFGGFVPVAALFAAHRALIAAASCSRRSGERLSFLFTFLGTDPCPPAGFICDFAVELRFFLPATAARAIDFLFAFAALALTKDASFTFNLASFFGPSSSRVSRRRIFFLRVLSFITRSGWLVYIDKCRVDLELNDETSQMSRHCFAEASIRPTSSAFTSYLARSYAERRLTRISNAWLFCCLPFLRDSPP